MMIVKDKAHNEWTYISGGCKLYETTEESAARELKEETRAAVQLDLAASKNYTRFVLETDYREPHELAHDGATKVITRYHIYLVDITNYRPISHIVRCFRRRGGCVKGAYDENSDIQFVSLQAFARRKDVWPFIRDVVLRHPSFRLHCSYLALRRPCHGPSQSAGWHC